MSAGGWAALGILGSGIANAYQQDQEQEQARTDMGGLLGQVGQISDPMARGPALLEGLIKNNPALAAKYGGQLAGMYQEQAQAQGLAAQRMQSQQMAQQRQAQADGILQQVYSMPEADQPAALARASAQMGPEFVKYAFEHQQAIQRGTQQNQMQLGQRDLENLRTGNDLMLQTQRQQAAVALANATKGAGGGAGGPAPGAPQLGGLGTGMARVLDRNGLPTDVGLPGSAAHIGAQEAISSNERAIARLQELAALVDKHGTETMAGPVKARMASLWGMATSDVAKARNMGVMQPGELAAVQDQMPDPSAWGSIMSGATGSAKGAYGQLLEEQSQIHRKLQGMYGGWPGLKRAPPVGLDEVMIAPGRSAKLASGRGWK